MRFDEVRWRPQETLQQESAGGVFPRIELNDDDVLPLRYAHDYSPKRMSCLSLRTPPAIPEESPLRGNECAIYTHHHSALSVTRKMYVEKDDSKYVFTTVLIDGIIELVRSLAEVSKNLGLLPLRESIIIIIAVYI